MASTIPHNTNDPPEDWKAPNFFKIEQIESDAVPLYDHEKPKTTLTQKQKGMKGMIYMAISAVFYSTMAFLLKMLYLHSSITAYEVTYW